MNKAKYAGKVLLVAFIYVLSARVGQLFAIDPGNVSPIWIPSGLMVALTLRYGVSIWPGVFLGAFIGNIWAYFTAESLSHAVAAICAASLNGIGDVFACVSMAYLVHQKTQSSYPFTSIRHYVWYLLLAVIAGPLTSAFFGVSGLIIFQFIPMENYLDTFMVWFIGDATGVMVFGPLLSAWLNKKETLSLKAMGALTALILYYGVSCAILFNLISIHQVLTALVILTMPVALFTVLYNGQRTAFTILFIISVVSIYATSQGKGFFVTNTTVDSFLYLQTFIAVFSLNIYTLSIFLYDKQAVNSKLNQQKEELEHLYRQDQLTKIWNRYRIKEFIELELSRFERYGQKFGIILFDIDNFKSVNDNLGHLEGDKVLIALSDLIISGIRESDLFGRWGGEEFVIVLTNSSSDHLTDVAEKIRQLIEQYDFKVNIRITVSVGATIVKAGDTSLTLFDRADGALYKSKKGGKNQVAVL